MSPNQLITHESGKIRREVAPVGVQSSAMQQTLATQRLHAKAAHLMYAAMAARQRGGIANVLGPRCSLEEVGRLAHIARLERSVLNALVIATSGGVESAVRCTRRSWTA